MRTVVLESGVKRILNVVNVGSQNQKVAVRNCDRPDETEVCRHVDILGPSRLWECRKPLPNTNGRAVVYLVTDAKLRLYYDDGGPIIYGDDNPTASAREGQ